MNKLSDTQKIVLSQAAAREDGFATRPATLNKAAAAKVGTSLVTRKLMREMRSKPDGPVWREDANGRSLSLVLTKQGRKVMAGDGKAAAAPAPAKPTASASASVEPPAVPEPAPQASVERAPLREGSKSAAVVAMLSVPDGVTLDAIVDATGWLPHSARAALTGLRKRGFAIARTKHAGKATTYCIVEPAPTPVPSKPRSGAKAVEAQAAL